MRIEIKINYQSHEDFEDVMVNLVRAVPRKASLRVTLENESERHEREHRAQREYAWKFGGVDHEAEQRRREIAENRRIKRKTEKAEIDGALRDMQRAVEQITK